MKIKILNVVGARPNFIKIAPIMLAMRKNKSFNPVLIHTGQHYDQNMSGNFFKDLNIPEPDIFLESGPGSHAKQTAKIMASFEDVLIKENPGLVLVVGDVNSTLACSIVSAKMNIPIAHVEAGLRSFDRAMPEEINRLVTDCLSDYLFTTCKDADRNLEKEGVPGEKIYFVGNVMIDTLKLFKKKALKLKTAEKIFGPGLKEYALLTLHRPSNVDNIESFERILNAVKRISGFLPVLFPAHPRTKKQIDLFRLQDYFSAPGIKLVKPLGYLDFLNLMAGAKLVLTDSGGIQEETTALNIPCLTLRENTERPVTVSQGTNTLVGASPGRIFKYASHIINGTYKKGRTPELWDGEAGKRIVDIIARKFL